VRNTQAVIQESTSTEHQPLTVANQRASGGLRGSYLRSNTLINAYMYTASFRRRNIIRFKKKKKHI
jgi:hypothetical protein